MIQQEPGKPTTGPKPIEVPRCFALKIARSNPGEQPEIALRSFSSRLVQRARGLMICAALVLSLVKKEDEEELRSMLKSQFRVLGKFVDDFERMESSEKAQIKGYVFHLLARGARGWDAFCGAAWRGKNEFGSLKKELEKLLEARRKELDELRRNRQMSLTSDPSSPKNLILELTAEEVEYLEAAQALVPRLETERLRPLKRLLHHLWMIPKRLFGQAQEVRKNGRRDEMIKLRKAAWSRTRFLRKLVLEAALQKLLGHWELMKLWTEAKFALELEEFKRKKEEGYSRYLKFQKENKTFFEELQQAPRTPAAFAVFLKRREIRDFYGEASTEDLKEVQSIEDLISCSRAIKWFQEEHAAYLRFRKGPGEMPTLTFIGEDHPFHFSLPGPRTEKGWYSLAKMPDEQGNPGQVDIKVFDRDWEPRTISLPFFGRKDLPELLCRDGDTWTFVQAMEGVKRERKVSLGGLRIRPRDTATLLDLVVKIQGDEPSPGAASLSFDKESKAWVFPEGLVVAAIYPHKNGTLWGVRMQRRQGGWVMVSSCEIKQVIKTYPQPEPVTVPHSSSERQRISGKDLGRLLHAVQTFRSNSKKGVKIPSLLGRIRQVLPEADERTEELLLAEQQFRDEKAKGWKPAKFERRSFSVGELLELERRRDALKRRLRGIKETMATSNLTDAQRRNLVRQKSNLIDEIKALAQHLLSCRDNRVREITHEVTRFVHGFGGNKAYPKADLVLLPGKPPKDRSYKRGKLQRSAKGNQALSAARSGEVCDRIVAALLLYGIRCLRIATAKTDLVCPQCGFHGVKYRPGRDKAGKPCVAAIGSAKKKPSKKKGEKKKKNKRARTEALAATEHFRCLSPSCGYGNYELRHIVARNMLARLEKGGQFAPEAERPNAKEAYAIAQTYLERH